MPFYWDNRVVQVYIDEISYWNTVIEPNTTIDVLACDLFIGSIKLNVSFSYSTENDAFTFKATTDLVDESQYWGLSNVGIYTQCNLAQN